MKQRSRSTIARCFETGLTTYLECRERWAASQVALADDFNLFRVMNVEYDEVRHSKVLAWLLDRRIEHGTHAQGNLGFRLFLEELQRDLAIESRPRPLKDLPQGTVLGGMRGFRR